MTRNKWLMAFGTGLFVGLAMAFLWPFGHGVPTADAQGIKADSRRFQVSAFGYPACFAPNSSLQNDATSGAYVVDTQTGTVWRVVGEGRPKQLGKAQ